MRSAFRLVPINIPSLIIFNNLVFTFIKSLAFHISLLDSLVWLQTGLILIIRCETHQIFFSEIKLLFQVLALCKRCLLASTLIVDDSYLLVDCVFLEVNFLFDFCGILGCCQKYVVMLFVKRRFLSLIGR